MRDRDVMLDRATVSRCTVSSGVFDGGDFVSFRMPSGADHWMILDLTILNE